MRGSSAQRLRAGSSRLLVVGLLLLGACSETSGSADEAPSPGSEPAGDGSRSIPVPTFDPPTSFNTDEDSGVLFPVGLGARYTTLYEDTAYVATGISLEAVDLTTGESVASLEPDPPLATADRSWEPSPRQAPAVVEADGRWVALVAYPGRLEGYGTTPGRLVAHLLALDTATKREAWRHTLDLETPSSSPGGRPVVTVVTVRDGILVIDVELGQTRVAYGIKIGDDAPLWKLEEIRALAGAGNTVIGVSERLGRQTVHGLRVADGGELWREEDRYRVSATAAGLNFALVQSNDYRNGDPSQHVVDATGAKVVDVPDPRGFLFVCLFDGQDSVICRAGASLILGLDAGTGEILWDIGLTEAARLVPEVTTVWHGAVYGKTANGPVVLDARTGEDLNPSPGLAPLAVNERCGLEDVRGRQIKCYWPTG